MSLSYRYTFDQLQVTTDTTMATTIKATDITVQTAIRTTTPADTIHGFTDTADSAEALTKDFNFDHPNYSYFIFSSINRCYNPTICRPTVSLKK